MAPPSRIHRSTRDEDRAAEYDQEIEDHLNYIRAGEPDYDAILKNRKEDADDF